MTKSLMKTQAWIKALAYLLILFALSIPITSSLPPSWLRDIPSNSLYRQISFHSGLNNRWTMFSTLHRGTYNYNFLAELENGDQKQLPVETQDPQRSWSDQLFFDYKIAKFHLNLFENELARKRYGSYLCRHHKNFSSNPMVAVILEHTIHDYLPRRDAHKLGTHTHTKPRIYHTERFRCD